MAVFPELGADEVLAASHSRWDLGGVVPIPREGWLVCPICGTPDPQPRYWRFHERSGEPTVAYRCDVSFKCLSCAMVWVHGVALDQDAWNRRPPRLGIRQIHWRDAQRLLEPEEPSTRDEEA